MSLPEDFLYDLLPRFIRNRDYYQGQPLRALMEVLDGEYRRMTDEVAALYDDWFIETCAGPAVAAIGDLLAVGEGKRLPEGFHPRAVVGNAIACRRRKGVPSALERVIHDASGWYARVVELSRRTVWSQALEAPRPGRGGTVDVRDEAALSLLGTAFETVPRTVAVRRPGRPRGGSLPAMPPDPGFNLIDLGIYVWRLQAYPLAGVEARRHSAGCYRFHPLGVDTPLFNQPRTAADPHARNQPENLPLELQRAPLAEAIADLRRGRRRPDGPFGGQPVLRITDPDTGKPIPPEAMEVADLGAWRRPPPGASYLSGRPGAQQRRPIQVAIDPERGRLAFPAGRGEDGTVEVAFSYGFPGDLGGGPYLIGEVAVPVEAAGWLAVVGDPTPDPGVAAFAGLAEALAAWAAAEVPVGAIVLAGGRSRPLTGEPAPVVDLCGGRRLAIAAAEPGPAVAIGDLAVLADQASSTARLTLRGLWLDGRVEAHGCLELEVEHCTLTRGVATHGPAAKVRVAHSIAGPIDPRDASMMLRLDRCIVDGGEAGAAIAGGGGGHGARLEIEAFRSTVLGKVSCSRIHRSEAVLFAAPLTVDEIAEGELRYCYVAPGSRTPHRYRCQPAAEVAGAANGGNGSAGAGAAAGSSPGAAPVFVSRRLGSPGYARLAASTPHAILTGSETGSEIGVFEPLYQPLREAALATVLAEYLPWGLEPRVVYVT